MQFVAATPPHLLMEGQVELGSSVQDQEVVRAYEISSHRDQYPKVTTIVRKSLDWNKERIAESRARQVLKMRDYLKLPTLKKRARENDSLLPEQPGSKRRKLDLMTPTTEDIQGFMIRIYLNTIAALHELSPEDIREYFRNQLFFSLPSAQEIVTMSHSAVFKKKIELNLVIQCETSHIPLDIRVAHPALQWPLKMITSSSENCRRWIEDHCDSVKQQYTQIARSAIRDGSLY
jgi:hypothetical protein